MWRDGKLRREVPPVATAEAGPGLWSIGPEGGIDAEDAALLACRACVLGEDAHLHGAQLYEEGRWLF